MERQAGIAYSPPSPPGTRNDSEKWHIVLGHNQGACGVTSIPPTASPAGRRSTCRWRSGADASRAGRRGPVADEDEDQADPFRFCIYCEADCYEEDPEHADDCPSTTGVFPVTKRDLVSISAEGELEQSGMRCMDCEDSFAAGDHYTHRHIGRGGPLLFLAAAPALGMAEADVYEVICLGCAALAAVDS